MDKSIELTLINRIVLATFLLDRYILNIIKSYSHHQNKSNYLILNGEASFYYKVPLATPSTYQYHIIIIPLTYVCESSTESKMKFFVFYFSADCLSVITTCNLMCHYTLPRKIWLQTSRPAAEHLNKQNINSFLSRDAVKCNYLICHQDFSYKIML